MSRADKKIAASQGAPEEAQAPRGAPQKQRTEGARAAAYNVARSTTSRARERRTAEGRRAPRGPPTATGCNRHGRDRASAGGPSDHDKQTHTTRRRARRLSRRDRDERSGSDHGRTSRHSRAIARLCA